MGVCGSGRLLLPPCLMHGPHAVLYGPCNYYVGQLLSFNYDPAMSCGFLILYCGQTACVYTTYIYTLSLCTIEKLSIDRPLFIVLANKTKCCFVTSLKAFIYINLSMDRVSNGISFAYIILID